MPIKGYKRGLSVLDFINLMADKESAPLTREEFGRIRREGTEEELIEAVEKMNAAGGYDNLD